MLGVGFLVSGCVEPGGSVAYYGGGAVATSEEGDLAVGATISTADEVLVAEYQEVDGVMVRPVVYGGFVYYVNPYGVVCYRGWGWNRYWANPYWRGRYYGHVQGRWNHHHGLWQQRSLRGGYHQNWSGQTRHGVAPSGHGGAYQRQPQQYRQPVTQAPRGGGGYQRSAPVHMPQQQHNGGGGGQRPQHRGRY